MKFGLFGHKKDTEEEKQQPVDDYQDVVARLTEYAKKDETTILVPVLGKTTKFYARGLKEATSAEIAAWVSYICPPLYKYGADTSAFNDMGYRETMFGLVIEYAKQIPETWAKVTRAASNFDKGLFTA